MSTHAKRKLSRVLMTGAVGVLTLAGLTFGTGAHAVTGVGNDLNFTPITTNALSCSETGLPVFADDKQGNSIVPTILM